MPDINCNIDIAFEYRDSVPVFSYFLRTCSPGWQVSLDGNIRPPDHARVIRIRLVSPGDATLYGLRFSTRNDDFPNDPTKDRYFDHTDGQVEIVSKEKSGEIVFRLVAQHTLLYYQLGIQSGSEIVWDDPRVYNDGSQ